jgi:hypothetical protein
VASFCGFFHGIDGKLTYRQDVEVAKTKNLAAFNVAHEAVRG